MRRGGNSRQNSQLADSAQVTTEQIGATPATAGWRDRCPQEEDFEQANCLRVALVCDWLTTVGGAENVLMEFHKMFPNAPIYTSQYDKTGIDWFADADVRTGWLQLLPSGARRFLGPLRQLYFSRLDLSDYDLIISVTGAEAKSVKKGTATHLCYCHVPTQYYWNFYDEYLKHPGFGILDPLARLALKCFVKPLRNADFRAAQRPDAFITISSYAAAEIKKSYNREATIIHPPVNVEKFKTIHTPVENSTMKKGISQVANRKQNTIKSTKSQMAKSEQISPSHEINQQKVNLPKSYFINYSRQVTWKRLDLIVKACLTTKQPLLLIGSGPEHENLVKLAAGSPLITFLPEMPQSDLLRYLKNAKAFIFPSLEPFGIAPVEALAAGVPVIAYGEGGSKDFIKPGENGLFFAKQTAKSLATAIKKFEHTTFATPAQISRSVENFSTPRFKTQVKDFIKEQMA